MPRHQSANEIWKILDGIEDPSKAAPEEHAKRVRDYNMSIHAKMQHWVSSGEREIAAFLEDEGADRQSIEVSSFMIGSDGRLEKGVHSPIETLFTVDADPVPDGNLHKRIHPWLREGVIVPFWFRTSQSSDLVRPIFSDLEVKVLDRGNISLYNQQPQATWPSRILDAMPLTAQSETHLHRAKRQLHEEVQPQNGKFGDSVLEREHDRCRVQRRITSTGNQTIRNQDTQHVDYNEGTAHYRQGTDRLPALGSFKFGPLRLVQTSIVARIVALIRNPAHGMSVEQLEELPQNTQQKLEFLSNEKLISKSSDERNDLIDNYHYFLWLYHQSEYQYFHHNHEEISFDCTEVNRRIDDLLRLVKSL